MYSTHRFNPKTPAPGEGFLTIGDAYDKPAGKADPRLKGRQFQTNPPKVGQLDGYFAKFEYVVDSYQGQCAARTLHLFALFLVTSSTSSQKSAHCFYCCCCC
jgi:hypothetical protein